MPTFARLREEEMERDLISERTKDALHLKIIKNERAGQIPYGWRLAEDRKRILESKKEQETIGLIRELSNNIYNYSALCRELTRQGCTPIGKQWHAQSIKNILKRAA